MLKYYASIFSIVLSIQGVSKIKKIIIVIALIRLGTNSHMPFISQHYNFVIITSSWGCKIRGHLANLDQEWNNPRPRSQCRRASTRLSAWGLKTKNWWKI